MANKSSDGRAHKERQDGPRGLAPQETAPEPAEGGATPQESTTPAKLKVVEISGAAGRMVVPTADAERMIRDEGYTRVE